MEHGTGRPTKSCRRIGRWKTNVCRFYNSVKDIGADGIKQLKWYDEGVGTKWYDRFIGGSVGAGLELNIVQGYEFLAKRTKTAMRFTSSDSVAARTRREAWSA
jgi:uncharacterized protein (DUF2235 family)